MLSLSQLTLMSAEERSRALSSLTSAPNGGAARLEAEIRALEQRYEIPSSVMRERVARGEVDTAETARWLVLLTALGR